MTDSVRPKLTSEDIVIIVVCTLGLIGGVILFYLNSPPIIISLFLATGLSALVYRFLGGIEYAVFGIGALKLAGVGAFLIGSAFWINSYLEKQLVNIFEPGINNWIAIDYEGNPIDVKIFGSNSVSKPDSAIFYDKPRRINFEGNRYLISSKKKPNFILGYVENADLSAAKLFNDLDDGLSDFIVTARLRENTSDITLDALPFRLNTQEFNYGHTKYRLVDNDGRLVLEDILVGRQAKILKLSGKFYLAAVVEFKHHDKKAKKNYSKFAFGKINPQITLVSDKSTTIK